MNGWCILCQSLTRLNDTPLMEVMVARPPGQKAATQWWTWHDKNIILIFEKRAAADSVIKRLRFGNPRAVPAVQAVRILEEQTAMIDAEFDKALPMIAKLCSH